MYGLHQGYSYQDLLAAFLISENLHKKDFRFAVEFRESEVDSFDDIVVVADGKKAKFQVKHSSTNQKLAQDDFVKKSSDLNLTKLAKSFSPDKDESYIIATNRDVKSAPCFIHQNKRKSLALPDKTYSINLGRTNNKKFLQRLVIEASLPNASFDLSKPGSLEKELLESLRLKVGIGYYPNNQVSARDIAGRLILLASNLRGSKESALIDREYIFKYISLNFEYGHIAQDFPFISPEYRLYRNQIVTKLRDLICKHKFTILEGSPGSGKSHIFDDLFNQISSDKVLVARHFCYLEPTDQLAQERIAVDTMYGNFLYQLEKFEPKIAEKIRPYFAATKTNVERMIEKITESGKKVVLMVDGLDHLNRVVAQNRLSTDLVKNFVADLLDMKLPVGCSVFIASQPSAEIEEVVKKMNAKVYSLQAWDEKLVKQFAMKHNNHLPTERQLDTNPGTVKALTEKTEGNPLYLTYVLKEIVSTSSKVDFSDYIQKLPKLNNDLGNYYRYLAKDIIESDFAVVQTLALLDFSVSRNELSEMFPPIQKRAIDNTLGKIRPILKPGVVQGGVRIYHESFRRFIIELGYRRGQQDRELYKHITNWLEKQGFFLSQRAYRYLIPYRIRSSEEEKTYKILGKDFVAQSLFYFHSVESINANLNKVADYAARKQHWEIYCKAVELSQALQTFSETIISVDEVYHQAILDVQGVDLFCERLLFDGKPVFPKPNGILLCQMAEHNGGNPPWDFYDVAGVSMQVKDASDIYEFQKVESAHFLNIIRLAPLEKALGIMQKMIAKNSYAETEQRQIGMLVEEFDHIFGVSRNYDKLIGIRISQKKKFCLSLSVAKYLYKDGHKKEASQLCTKVIQQTKDLSQILNAVLLGGRTKSLIISQDITRLTQMVLAVEYPGDEAKIFIKEWYQLLIILSHTKPSVIKEATKLVDHVDGWYRAWILYLFELSLLEASILTTENREKSLEGALEKLNKYAHPFRGKPRAMDLYSIRDLSTDSFRRTLMMAKGFSNYSVILNLLSNISIESTSYLQGSSDGPLNGETFNSLLKEGYPSLDEEKRKIVRKILEENTQEGTSSSVYYYSYAFEYLKLATIFSLHNNSKKSKQYLMNGCIYLAAYGHHKDVTIFKILGPIGFIARKNLKFSINALKKSFSLVETVWRYTNGKETNYSLVYWIKALVVSDIRITMQTLAEMVKINPERSWRVEEGTEYLCEKLLESKIYPEKIADLYETIDQTSNTRINVSIGLEIVQVLLKKRKKGRAQKLFDHVYQTLYWVSISEYVSDKRNYTKIISFADTFKLKIKSEYRNKFEEESNKAESSKLPPLRNKEKVPSFSFSRLSVDEIRRLIDENSHNHFLHPKNIKNFAKALSKLENEHSSGVYDLVLSVVRRGIYAEEDINGLITLIDIFRADGRDEMSAFVSMLGFIYARRGDRWDGLTDSKYNYLGNDALQLSKEIAKKTLASEMSYIFSGSVRQFIEFFSKNAQVNMAENIWNEVYEVIRFRLPTHKKLDKILDNETPSLSYSRRSSLNTLVDRLISARKKIV